MCRRINGTSEIFRNKRTKGKGGIREAKNWTAFVANESLSLSLFLFEKKNDDEKIMVTRYRTKK